MSPKVLFVLGILIIGMIFDIKAFMIGKINNWLIKKYLNQRSELGEFDKERIEYALGILINESEKILAIVIIFIMICRVEMFLISFVVLMSLRIFIGGLHFSTRSGCFVFSTLFFVTTVFLSEFFYINKLVGLIIGCLACINISSCAPLASKHRILVTERGRKTLRKQSMVMLTIWLVCYMVLRKMVANVIIWTVIMQQMELLYYKCKKRKDKKKNDEEYKNR